MPKIKGPFNIKKGESLGDLIQKKAQGLNVKLPFSAKGWKSSKTPKNADMSTIEEKKTSTKSSPKKKTTKK